MSPDEVAVQAILSISGGNIDRNNSIMLSPIERIQFKNVSIHVRSLIDCRFSFKKFYKSLCDAQLLPLELLWRLHLAGILPLEVYLAQRDQDSTTISKLCESIEALCALDLGDEEICSSVICGVFALSVIHCFGDIELENVVLAKTPKVIFERILKTVLKKVVESHLKPDLHLRLNPVVLLIESRLLEASLLKRFLLHYLNIFVTYEASVGTLSAIQEHEKWFNEVEESPSTTLEKMYTILKQEEVNSVLYNTLKDGLVNWKLYLAVVKSFLIFSENSEAIILSLVDGVLKSALEEKNATLLSSGFLIIRHSTLLGFPKFSWTYSSWYKTMFCERFADVFTEKEALSIVLEFLASTVPFDEECHLKAHVENKPSVPVDHRAILMDYIKLARTRLDDIKAKALAGSLLDKMVASFEATNRIPSAVLEASMMHKHHYHTQFLPSLLTPRLLPSKPDAKMRLIEELKTLKKIPKDMYEKYIVDCEKLAAEAMVISLDDSFDIEMMNEL